MWMKQMLQQSRCENNELLLETNFISKCLLKTQSQSSQLQFQSHRSSSYLYTVDLCAHTIYISVLGKLQCYLCAKERIFKCKYVNLFINQPIHTLQQSGNLVVEGVLGETKVSTGHHVTDTEILQLALGLGTCVGRLLDGYLILDKTTAMTTEIVRRRLVHAAGRVLWSTALLEELGVGVPHLPFFSKRVPVSR